LHVYRATCTELNSVAAQGQQGIHKSKHGTFRIGEPFLRHPALVLVGCCHDDDCWLR
jgi:hypothetical protein